MGRPLRTLLPLLGALGCSSPAVEFDPALGARLQQALVDGNAKDSCWGMTATVSVPGKGTWRGATGFNDIVARTPMPADGTFRIGSITKSFTSTVFLQLVSEGKLGLDDKLSRFVPDFPGADGITMRQVLSHTAGIFDYAHNGLFLEAVGGHPHRVWTPRELIAYAASQPPYFAPGMGYHYSNTDYVLAGMAIQQVTGSTIDRLIRARIFDPLGLSSAYFAGAEPDRGALVRGYDDTGRDLTTFYDLSGSWAAGAVASNGDDLNRFQVALQTGKLLDSQRLDEMRTVLGGGYYGLGLMRFQTPLGPAWGHNGVVLGYWTQSAYVARNGVALSLLCDVFTFSLRSPIATAWDRLLGVLAATTADAGAP